MASQLLNGKKAVDDYFSSLLHDDFAGQRQQVEEKSQLRFAHVKAGFQLVALWDLPLNDAQSLCRDLFILSCLKTVAGMKLRAALFNSIQMIKR